MYARLIGDRLYAAAKRAGYVESVIFATLPRRARVLRIAASPVAGVRYLRHRFDLWTAQPGQVFGDLIHDSYVLLDTVKADHVIGVEVSRQLLDAPRPLTLVVRGDPQPVLSLSQRIDGRRLIVSPTRFDRGELDQWTRCPSDVTERVRDMVARARA